MKRMGMILCVILVALLCINAPAKAQFGLYGGLALPTGDFGSTDANEKSGFAKTGFCGGLELIIGLPIETPIDIGIVVSGTVLYNELDNKQFGSQTQGVSIDANPWLTGWPMIGGRVSLPVGQLSFYATLQLGGVVAIFPETTIKNSLISTASSKTTYKADPVVKFVAFSAGAGVGFGPLRLGLRYLDAGEVEFEIKYESGSQKGTEKVKRPISALCITVGIEL